MATQTTLTPDNFIDDYARARIDFRVGRLVEAFHLDDDAADDLRQNMTAEILRASARYDPARARRRTFVTRVLDRYYLHVARGLSNRQKHESMHPTPMSALENFCPTVNDPRQGQLSECERAALVIDLATVVAGLPDPLQRICDELRHRRPAEAAQRLGVHRGTVYRAIREIRQHFVAAGLGDAA